MHIFLTGERQTGKSTALRRFLAETKISADGFMTFFDVRGENRTLYLARFDTEAADIEQRPIARITSGGVIIYGEVFESFGRQCLVEAGKRRVILMDELGSMEEGAPLFKEAVLSRLNGDKTVVGVIKAIKSPFLDAVLKHPKVEVIALTKKNRDNIPALLKELLNRDFVV